MTQTIGYKRPVSHGRRAFSLAELMTAVGILGIGMMMIAMAFPVALDQTRQAVELSTSQLVFNEAVNTLKTQVKWTELDRYINNINVVNNISYDLTPSPGVENYIRVIDFGLYLSGTPVTYFFQNFYYDTNLADGNAGTFLWEKLTFSHDKTYGWVSAVQKRNNQYKFWIFVLREPKGIAETTHPHFSLFGLTYPAAITGKQLTLSTTMNNLPMRGEILLGDDGTLYTVTDVGEENTSTHTVKVMLDKEVSYVTGKVLYYFAHVTGTGFTRKNPVISVYQTVISY